MRLFLLSNYVVLILAVAFLLPSNAQADGFDEFYSAVTIKVDPSDCEYGKFRAVIGRKWGERLNWIPSDCTGVTVDEFDAEPDDDIDGPLVAFFIRWSDSDSLAAILPEVSLDLDELEQESGLYIESCCSTSLPIRLADGDGPYVLQAGVEVKTWPYGPTNSDGENKINIFVNFGTPFLTGIEDRDGAESRMIAALSSGKLETPPIVIRQAKNKRNK